MPLSGEVGAGWELGQLFTNVLSPSPFTGLQATLAALCPGSSPVGEVSGAPCSVSEA